MRYLLCLSVIAIMFLSIVSCGGSGGGQGGADGGYTSVKISFGHLSSSSSGLSAQQVPPAVSYIRLYITGPGMAPVEIITSDDSVSIEVPSGPDRHFEIFAYDVNDVLLYYGDTITDLDAPVTLNIYMSQVQPDISVSPAFHDFGNVDTGDTSAPQTFTVSNTGFMADLDIGTITLTGQNASEFAIQNDTCSGQTIAPAGSCTVDAVFSPASVGARSANLSIPSNDPDTPTLDVPLSGTGTGFCDLNVDVNTGIDTGDCSNILSPCQTITYALTQTAGNESICAAAGTYNSSAGETFPLQLKSGTSLICQGADYTTMIEQGTYGTAILGAEGASVSGCTIIGDPAVDDNGTATTVNNSIIDLGGDCCTGIALSGDSTVTNSIITGVEDGDVIDVSGGSPNITNNSITNNRWSNGVNISGGNPTLTGNTITYNEDGVQIYGGSATITGNTITNNDYRGVSISNTSPTLTGNTITDNSSVGVFTGGGSPTLSGNTITDNYYGVSVWSGTPVINTNILSCNTAIDLWNWTAGPPINAQNNQWDHVPPTEINYPDTCASTGEDTCSQNLGGSVDFTGASLAPSPCAATTGTVNLPQTGQTTIYATGDDGDIQAGVPWPSPRFTGNGDGTVTDDLTGLIWTQDGNAPGPVACSPGVTKNWQDALDYVTCLNSNNYLGYTDWRLPNMNELKSLNHSEEANTATWLNTQGFTNVQAFLYWSSTTFAGGTAYASVVRWDGYVFASDKTNVNYVWPVRGPLGPLVITLPVTGQTTSYSAGDDGDLQSGVPWPAPRFTDNGDGTVTDDLTGLIWTQDGNAPGPVACSPGVTKNWQDALDYVTCLNSNNYLGYTDWRLPNMNELKSLIHSEEADTATWLNTQGFTNVQTSHYWSSTTYANDTGGAWIVLWDGLVGTNGKAVNRYVWPVRAGQ